MEKGNIDSSIYGLMQTGKPYKSYIKTILGKVYVNVWNSFENKPEGRIFEGDPRNKEKEKCVVDVWNEMEDVFLRRTNKRHFETGVLIPFSRKEEKVEKSPNEVTDEELESLLNSKFLKLQHAVNKFTEVAPIFRILEKAKEMEKSEKIVRFIESKLSEIQQKSYKSPISEETEED